MFSGIIQTIGSISKIIDYDSDKRMMITLGNMDPDSIEIGDSICVNGVCLTVIEKNKNTMHVDVSAETLFCTTFNEYMVGRHVNLEQALQPNDKLNGHIVSGHIDGVGKVISITDDARSIRYIIEVPSQFRKYICQKGSICIDGVSLTINEVNTEKISINIVPYTRENTIFSEYTAGTRVNIEVDIIARYLESLHQYCQ